jgi:hypothetical protein
MIKCYYKNKNTLPNNIKKGRFKMAVAAKHLEEIQKKHTVSTKEIESYFGFDKVKPITLTPSDQLVKDEE